MKKASNLFYFIAGASVENMKVCYDSYFMHQCIKEEINDVIADFGSIINMKYNPNEIVEFLKK